MKIYEQQLVLALTHNPIDDIHSVSLLNGSQEAVAKMSGYVRLSPVWLCDRNDTGEAASAVDIQAFNSLAFLSFTNPEHFFGTVGAKAEAMFPDSRFLVGLGAYNLIVPLSTQDGMDEVIRYSEENQKSAEIWHFKPSDKSCSREVKSFEYFQVMQDEGAPPKLDNLSKLLAEKNEAFHPITFELATLLHTGYDRSLMQSVELNRDIVELSDRVVEKFGNADILKDIDTLKDGERSVVLSNLHNINAGLSRLNSQAFCGVTPINKSEGHFGPHSLLGLGIANIALRNLVGFISNVNEKNSLSPKMVRLLSEREVVIANDYFGGELDLVDTSFEALRPVFLLDEIDAGKPSPTWTPITYYSGRDGFKNSEYTTSAPLMSISASNSRAWSLMTVTHEVSHRIFSSIVGRVLKMLDQGEIEAKTLKQLTSNSDNSERIMADVFLECIYFTLVGLAEEHSKLSKRDPSHREDPYLFNLLMHEYFEEVEEIFVHLFDFWYFYDRDSSQYLKSIWTSWAVIPEIETRLDEYLLRSIVAICTKNVGRENWLKNSIQEVRLEFERGSLKDGFFLQEQVVNILREPVEVQAIIRSVERRKHIVKLFHLFFKSVDLAGDFKDDELHGKTGDGKRTYSYTPRKFELAKFENPIRLIEFFANDEQPNATKSMWLLQLLALNWHPKFTREVNDGNL